MDTFRNKFEKAYREYRAIKIFAGMLPRSQRKILDESLETIKASPKKVLVRRAKELHQELKALKALYGARDVSALVEYIEDELAEYGNTARLSVIYLGWICQQLPNFLEKHPSLKNLPPHTRIGIDIVGNRDRPDLEFFLLEATLFEDMASLWNLYLSKEDGPIPITPEDKHEVKLKAALGRSTVKAAFGLLEAYLTGLAADIILTRNDLTTSEETRLYERDKASNRPKPLSLKDKIQLYPKIALRTEHPPLTASHKLISRLLDLEQQYRHAFIHPTPIPPPGAGTPREEQHYLLSELEIETVVQIVLEVIREIDAVLGSKFGPVERWMVERDPNRLFPVKAFA